jgi:voltage-gated potassium channel
MKLLRRSRPRHDIAPKSFRRRLYDLLESRHLRGWHFVVQSALILLILANVLAVVLETIEPLEKAYAEFFHWFEIVSVAIFTLEYAARMYAVTAGPREQFRHPVLGRLRFALSPLAIIDLVAIMPLFVLVLFGLDLGSLRLVRILRILKLLRYSPSMAMLGRVVYNERKTLTGALIVFLILLLLSSTVAYYAERVAQPKTFGSIPDAMWWAMAALTTVGYGDVTPITALGRVAAGVITLLGILVIALPTGIIASGFIEEAKRRDFVVTWQLLTEIPFFGSLTAPRIADLVRILRPRFVPAGEAIVRKGEEGDSMFIIASGEVDVELAHPREPVRLETGQFFGEMALIEKRTRSATVRAVEECKLLEMGAKDFHELTRQHPELRDSVHKIAAERKAYTGQPKPAPTEG